MRFLLALFFTGGLILSAFARESTPLMSDWRFIRGEASGAEKLDFADASWEKLSLPHSWGWEEAQQGKNYYRGAGWYRRDLVVNAQKGKRYFVRFGAAGSVADVYVNGRWLGQHRGAFGAFCYEITSSLSQSGTNLLAVRVSNAAEPDIAPLSGDFCVFGGLYRTVELIETSDVNFTLTDHASPGVSWLQTNVTAGEAVLEVKTEISNGTRGNRPLTLVAQVLDADGKLVGETNENIALVPSYTTPFSLRISMAKPHLWNGRQDPYLYRAVVQLRSANGELLDSVEQPLGLRFYHLDNEKGFFLNGQPYHLHGVNRHQDRWNEGWAVSPAQEEEDVAMLKDIGATVVRCSHYQQSDHFVSLCDQAGILVWAELSQVDKVGADPRFAETSRNQLLDLIRQNINHPSIFAWSLFNEIRPNNPDPHRILQDENVLAHGEDPTRPTIAATCTEKLPQMDQIPDWLGWNIYPGWYSDWGPLSEFGKTVDDRRFTSRAGAFCISEYGAGANIDQHQENPRQPKNDGQWHPEEYQTIFHEAAWADLKARPFIWGTFVWCMFDFTSYWRHEGGLLGRNDKGLVTYDRKVKKDAYYFYKANWNPEPMVYITSRRFTERTNAVTDVKVYSNAKTVELFMNGASQGKRSDAVNGVFLWKAVPLKPGENHVVAHAGEKLADECLWTLKTQ